MQDLIRTYTNTKFLESHSLPEAHKYAYLIFKCVQTGSIYKDLPQLLYRVEENKVMYSRHINNEQMMLLIEPVQQTDEFDNIDLLIITDDKKNPFNAKFNDSKLPSITDSSMSYSEQQEAQYCKIRFNGICRNMYQQYIKSGKTLIPYGSCVHTGLVSIIFNYGYDEKYNTHVNSWISTIGPKYSAHTIAELKGYESIESIYENQLYKSDVKRICKYCELMFNVDKFTVAKDFKKTNPESWIEKSNNVPNIKFDIEFVKKYHPHDYESYMVQANEQSKLESKRHYLYLAALTYAELGNVDSAKELFVKVATITTEHNLRDYKGLWLQYTKMLEEYIQIHSTCIFFNTSEYD